MLGCLGRLVPASLRCLSAYSTQSAAESASRRSSWRWSTVVGLSLGAGVGASLLVYQPMAEDLRAAYLTPIRLARDVYTAAAIVAGTWPNALTPNPVNTLMWRCRCHLAIHPNSLRFPHLSSCTRNALCGLDFTVRVDVPASVTDEPQHLIRK